MSLVRRRLSWIAIAWLVGQMAGMAAAPFAFCCEQQSFDGLPECCQGVGPGQTCPMHHTRRDDTTCKMRNACVRGDSALISLGGGLGVVPPPTIGVIAFVPGERALALIASAIQRAAPPDSPPPRLLA
jgi:hypothetical protein